MHTPFPIPVFAWLLSSVVMQTRVDAACINCASTILKSQWQATGFPSDVGPLNMTFGDKDCSAVSDGSALAVECPSDVCVEMLVAVAGQYAVMRGCFQTLLGSYRDEFSVVGGDDCYFGGTTKSVTIDGKVINNAVEGVHYCTDSLCNDNLAVSTAQDCLSCYRYDNKGWCGWNLDRQQTCKGVWCTKTVGFLNDRYLEIRGCSNINPLNNAMCVKMETDSTLALFGTDSIVQHYSAEQCMCIGNRCNGGDSQRSWALLILALSCLVPALAHLMLQI